METAIGIDIGGTFTDIVVLDGRGPRLFKFLSTPNDPAQGVLHALAELIERGEIAPSTIQRIAHGSTVVTNALLEGKWGKTALVTTRGFRDVLEIGRQNRPSLYDLFFERPEPIVPRDLRFEITERVDAQGNTVHALVEPEVHHVCAEIRKRRVESVAVCFLFSFLDPTHERRVGEILAQELGLPVTLSSDLHPEFREYERTSTTVVNAALRPVVGTYLSALEAGAAGLGLPARWQVMQSSGAIAHAGTVQDEPARILLSGPAGGVEGARVLGRQAGFADLITMDMGGTSCDVALIRNGHAARTTGGAVGGHPVALPMTDIHTIGAGGGSIAWLDPGGALRVGPRSAGADPGPACYGRGGREPTVTDAHLVLGHLLPEFPLGGLPKLDPDAARTAVGKIAGPLGLAVEQAALGILEVADAAMERAIRVISIERGHDPRGFALLSFGGAGPLHAVALARRLAIPHVLIPPTAGVLSALGLLLADVGHEVSQGTVRPLRALSPTELPRLVEPLHERAASELVAHGADPGQLRFATTAALRYQGQSHELDVPFVAGTGSEWLASLEAAFHEEHRRRYGHAAPTEDIELVALRVRASAPPPSADIRPVFPPAPPLPATSQAWFRAEGPIEARLVHRNALGPGARIEGPAVLLGDDATALVPAGSAGTVDAYDTLVVEVG